MSSRATAATRKRIVDIHRDDTALRHRIMHQLIVTRMRTTDRVTMARALGITTKGVWALEHEPEPNPQLDTIQRYARAVGRRLVMTPASTLEPDPDDPTIALLAAMTDKGSPARADDLHRSRVLAHLLSVRLTNGITQQMVAAAIGCSEAAVGLVESDGHRPWLSTYQRYARAIGVPLDVRLEPVAELVAA